MVTRHVRGKITWVDIESPTHDELDAVMREFGIDPTIEDEIITPTPYPIQITFPNYLYLILHFPVSDPEGGSRNQEVDFVVGKNFLLTARYEVIEPIHTLHKVFEAEELLGIPKAPLRSDRLLERILRRLYGAIREETDHVARLLDRIEHDIFSGRERQTVRNISEIARTLLRFDTALARHAEPLSLFLSELAKPAFFGEGFLEDASHIEAEREHVAALIASYRAIALELRETNDSMLSASQNEVMKTLTVFAFIGIPITLISQIFGMNVSNIPFATSPYAFWIIMAIMVVVGLVFYIFARFKKWL